MRLRLRALADDRGFTMIEMIVASALFFLMLGAVLGGLDAATRSERISQARNDALTDLRATMQQLTKELRQATSINPASTATRLDMCTYLSTGTPTRVVYQVAGTAPNAVFQRTQYTGCNPSTGPSTRELTDRVVAPQAFCYQFDDPNCLATSPTATMSSVRVTLTLSPVVLSSGNVTLASDVELRNL